MIGESLRDCGYGNRTGKRLSAPSVMEVGVAKMDPSMINARIGDAGDPSERRRSPRLGVDLEATVRELGETGVDARILNISESGFMADADGHFEVGARIWLMLPGRGRANAVVKWIAGDKIGAEFAEPISIEGLID